MKIGNAAFELADRRAEEERDAGIRSAQAAVAARPGRFICDCGEQISDARRKAAPFTDKCIDCATRAEQRRRA